MPIDSARVSKADGSQSLEVPAEQGAVLRRATEEFEQRMFPYSAIKRPSRV